MSSWWRPLIKPYFIFVKCPGWIGCLLLLCRTAAQVSIEGTANLGTLSALQQGWEEGSGLLAVGAPAALARTVFLPHSQTELNTQREEQALFSLLLATCLCEPQKRDSFCWEVPNFKSFLGQCPTLGCALQMKISRQKMLESLFWFWLVPET